jgi:hypothetical protein
VNESLALLMFTGDWTYSPRMAPGTGWCIREPDCLRCKLCTGKVDPRDVPGHAHSHVIAIAEQYDAFCSLIAMAEYEQGEEGRTSVSDIVETVFGFRPNTPASKQFWKQHGGTEP